MMSCSSLHGINAKDLLLVTFACLFASHFAVETGCFSTDCVVNSARDVFVSAAWIICRQDC